MFYEFSELFVQSKINLLTGLQGKPQAENIFSYGRLNIGGVPFSVQKWVESERQKKKVIWS